MAEAKNYKEVSIESLMPFANHPFTQYEGQRFTDMVESVRANGIITPIVVRPTGKGQHEILSGHNRVSAAKEAGLKTVPAIIRSGLTDDEAMLIVTETNLIQRSFADLKHSERAIALATHYDAMKKKSGYRSDLLEEIDKLTSSPVGTRLATKDRLAEQYGLSKNTIMRYLRINKLIAALKERLDNGGIGMRVAEALSYLRVKEQAIVEDILATGKRISIKQADELHKESKQGELGKKYINRVFDVGFFPTKVKPVKFSGQFLSQYFDEKQSPEMIESVMAEALAKYFAEKE